MEVLPQDNTSCVAHKETKATHVCLDCNEFYCINCSFNHSHKSAESTNFKGVFIDHNVQPLSNLAAKTIEKLQVALHRKEELMEREKYLSDLDTEFSLIKSNNELWIDGVDKDINLKINEIRIQLSKKSENIKIAIDRMNKEFTERDKEYLVNTDFCKELQNEYNNSYYKSDHRNIKIRF